LYLKPLFYFRKVQYTCKVKRVVDIQMNPEQRGFTERI